MNNQRNNQPNVYTETKAAKNVVAEQGGGQKNSIILGDVTKPGKPRDAKKSFVKQYIGNKPLLVLSFVIVIFISLISILVISTSKQPTDDVIVTSQAYNEYVKSVEEKKLIKNANDEEKNIFYNSKLGLLINNGDMPKAYDYYAKEKLGEQNIQINTQYYVLLADYLKTIGDMSEAKKLYQKAIAQIDKELASVDYPDSDKQDILMQRDYLTQTMDKL